MLFDDVHSLPHDWRDSSPAKYLGPVRLRIDTQMDQAAPYIDLGRSLLGLLRHHLALSGRPHGLWRRTLPNGAVVTVSYDGIINNVWIETSGVLEEEEFLLQLSLESAWVYIQQQYFLVGGIEEPLPLPACQAYYTDAIKAVCAGRSEDNTAIVWMDTLQWDDELSDKPDLNAVRDPVQGMDSWALPGGILDRRHFRRRSVRGGKLEFWIRAILGLGTPEWDVAEHENEQSGALTATQEVLSKIAGTRSSNNWQDVDNSYALYTDEETLTYYFLEIGVDSEGRFCIFATPLLLSDAGSRLRSHLLSETGLATPKRERLRVEAYCLSEAVLNTAMRGAVALFAERPAGVVFYYGWHFNWACTEGHIVTWDQVNVLQPDGILLRTHYNTMRHYRMDITPVSGCDPTRVMSISNSPLTASYQVLETVNHTPDQTHHLWIPNTDLAFDRMETIYWKVSTLEYPVILYNDAPIYCYWQRPAGFYDGAGAETLIMVRHVRAAPEDRSGLGEPTLMVCSPLSSGEVDERRYANYQFDGYYTSVIDARTYFGNGSRWYSRLSGVFIGNPVNQSGSAYIYNIGYSCEPNLNEQVAAKGLPFDTPVDLTKNEYWYYRKRAAPETSYESGKSACVIPFDDADGVYLLNYMNWHVNGSMDHWRARFHMDLTVTSPEGYTPYYRYMSSGYPSSDGEHHDNYINERLSAIETVAGPPRDGDGPYDFTEYSVNGWLGSQTNSAFQAINVAFRGGAGYPLTETQAYNALGAWNYFWAPVMFGPDAYPFFDRPFRVQESRDGAILYSTDLSQASEGDRLETTDPNIPIATTLWDGHFIGWS